MYPTGKRCRVHIQQASTTAALRKPIDSIQPLPREVVTSDHPRKEMGLTVPPLLSQIFLGLVLILGMTLTSSPGELTPGLNALLNLHQENCPTQQLCTIQAELQEEPASFPSGNASYTCCPPCSCNESCLALDNCCADFVRKLLTQTTNDVRGNSEPISTDIQELIHDKTGTAVFELHKKRLKDIFQEESDLALEASILKRSVCTDVAITSPPPNKPSQTAYFMVASCPPDYPSDSEISSQCIQVNATEYKLADRTPVTSMTTYITYKNKFCMACNEPDNSSQSWDAELHCHRYTTIQIPAADQLDDVAWYAREHDECSVVFKADLYAIGSAFVFSCIDVQITSCNVSGQWQTYDQALDEACRLYRSPVTALGSYSIYPITLNNIACLPCNAMATDHSCHFNETIASDELVTVRLNAQTSSIGYLPSADFPREHYSDSKHYLCGKGQLYDKYIGKCRDTFCPRDHATQDAYCSPIFDIMNGVTISLQLKLKLETNFFMTNMLQLEEAIHEAIFGFFHPHDVPVCRLGVWRKYKDQQKLEVDYFFIYVALKTGMYTSYSYLRYIVKNLVHDELPFGEIPDLNNQAIAYHLTFANETIMATESDGTLVTDLNDGQQLEESETNSEYFNDECMVSIAITANSFCERIALDENEYEIKGKYLYLKLSKNLVNALNYDLSKDKKAFICIDEFNKMQAKYKDESDGVQVSNVNNINLDASLETDPGSVSVNVSFFLGIIITTVFLCGVFLILGLMRKQCFSQQRQQQHITMTASASRETQEIA